MHFGAALQCANMDRRTDWRFSVLLALLLLCILLYSVVHSFVFDSLK